jgi:hypothetical protein
LASNYSKIKRHFDWRAPGEFALARKRLHAELSEPDLKVYTRESPEGELKAGEGYEGREGIGEILVVLGEAPIAAEPGKGAFDDPGGARCVRRLRQPVSSRPRCEASSISSPSGSPIIKMDERGRSRQGHESGRPGKQLHQFSLNLTLPLGLNPA